MVVFAYVSKLWLILSRQVHLKVYSSVKTKAFASQKLRSARILMNGNCLSTQETGERWIRNILQTLNYIIFKWNFYIYKLSTTGLFSKVNKFRRNTESCLCGIKIDFDELRTQVECAHSYEYEHDRIKVTYNLVINTDFVELIWR